MPLLTRKKQLAAVPQRVAALPSGLDSATNATTVALDAVANLDVERIERNLIRDTISAVQDLPGQKAVEFTFGVELKGSNDGLSEPSWARMLEACSFRSEVVDRIEIGTITATGTSTTFRHGETILGGTSGATATVVRDTHNGVIDLYYDQTSLLGGPFTSGETLTGSDSGAEATTTGVADTGVGFGYWPISVVEKTILFDITGLTSALAAGDLIEGTVSGARGIVTRAATVSADTLVYYNPVRGSFDNGEMMARINNTPVADIGDLASPNGESYAQYAPLAIRLYTDGKAVTGAGCRGNVVFNFEVNRPTRMDFTFRGTLSSTADEPLIGGIDYENAQPPLWESSAIGFADNDDPAEVDADDEIEPCLNTMTVDMGVNLADRKCAGATNGLLEVFGSVRDANGTMDPEDTLEADIPWLGYVADGGVLRLGWTVGAVLGNSFSFSMPGIQFTQQSEGDRDSIVTQDMTFRVTGGDLFDLDTPTNISSIGGDNEVVLIYHTS